MNVRFGNLSVLQFEEKVGTELSLEDRLWMENHRVDHANFHDDSAFHIFDLPLGFSAGHDIAEELIARLRKYGFEKCHFYVEQKEAETSSTPD